MSGKIPPDALEYYLGLGPDRSYQKVADHYGVSKRAVTKLAARERWRSWSRPASVARRTWRSPLAAFGP